MPETSNPLNFEYRINFITRPSPEVCSFDALANTAVARYSKKIPFALSPKT
jgi:hypothetical protein